MSNVIARILQHFNRLKTPALTKRLFSIEEAAEITGVDKRKIYEMAKQGKIFALQISKHGNFCIPDQELERIRSFNKSAAI